MTYSIKTMSSLFFIFLKLAIATFGGGMAMVPILKREAVETHNWLSEEQFVEMMVVTQSAPGVIAIKFAVYLGYRAAGLGGVFFALLGLSIPSVFIMTFLAALISSGQGMETVDKFFFGVRPTVVALILGVGLNMGRNSLKSFFDFALFLFCLVLLVFFSCHPLLVILIGALAGIAKNKLGPQADKEVAP